jgi:hypothetical protein
VISVDTGAPGAVKDALNQSGWISDEVVAAGQLRQGKAPTMLQMMVGFGVLLEIFRRRTKLLPRHFVLAVTSSSIHAYKAVGGSPEHSSDYTLRIFDGEKASFPRSSVRMSDLPEGAASKGGIMSIDGESFPVMRPNLNGDPNTDELIALLAGLEAPGDAPPDLPPASSGGLVV